MSAVVVCEAVAPATGDKEASKAIPGLWVSCGDWVELLMHPSKKDQAHMSVYASWDNEYPAYTPHAICTMSHGPFHVDMRLAPTEARALAANLIKAAYLAEIHQALLDAAVVGAAP